MTDIFMIHELRTVIFMPPKDTPDKRDEKARDYADAIPDDEALDNGYEPTYRDGSLKNECWDDRAWNNNTSESNDWRDE